MSRLSDLLETSRGEFRAYFNGEDLGALSKPPEIRANYTTRELILLDEVQNSRTAEGSAEKRAKIELTLRSVKRLLTLLSQDSAVDGELKLLDISGGLILTFPCSRLLPQWELHPSVNGHCLTVHFSSSCNDDGKLFYC